MYINLEKHFNKQPLLTTYIRLDVFHYNMDNGSILVMKYNVKNSTVFNDIFNVQQNIKMYLN